MQFLLREASLKQVDDRLMEVKELQSQLVRKDKKLTAIYEQQSEITADLAKVVYAECKRTGQTDRFGTCCDGEPAAR